MREAGYTTRTYVKNINLYISRPSSKSTNNRFSFWATLFPFFPGGVSTHGQGSGLRPGPGPRGRLQAPVVPLRLAGGLRTWLFFLCWNLAKPGLQHCSGKMLSLGFFLPLSGSRPGTRGIPGGLDRPSWVPGSFLCPLCQLYPCQQKRFPSMPHCKGPYNSLLTSFLAFCPETVYFHSPTGICKPCAVHYDRVRALQQGFLRKVLVEAFCHLLLTGMSEGHITNSDLMAATGQPQQGGRTATQKTEPKNKSFY